LISFLTEDKGKLAVILTLIVVGIFYLSTIRGGHDWGGDFAQYFEHARNIAEGNDYDHSAYIKNPNRSLAPDVYPPGLPLFISIIYIVDGFNLIAIKVMSCFFFFGSLVLVYFMFRGRMSDYYIAVVIGITALYPRFWEYKDMTFSEFPFIFFAFLTLYLTEKAFDSNYRERWKSILLFGLIALFLILATATRVVGGILVPVIVVYFFQKIGRLKYFLIGSSIALLFAAIIVLAFSDLFEGLLSYLSVIQFSPSRVLTTAQEYAALFAHFWDNYSDLIFHKGVSVILLLFALLGFYFSCREKITIYDIFFVFYLGFHLIVSWSLNRFLLPLYPLYVYYTVLGVNHLIKFKKPQINIALKVVLVILVLQMFISKYKQYDFDYIKPGISTPAAVELFEYINQETNDSSVIVFRKPRVISLFTKRKSLVYHTAPYPELADYFNSQGVTHLILGRFYDDGDYIEGFWNVYAHCFELELTNSEFNVYKVIKEISKDDG